MWGIEKVQPSWQLHASELADVPAPWGRSDIAGQTHQEAVVLSLEKKYVSLAL